MPHRVNHLVGGRYRIHTPIGSGGMGSVYQATDEVLGREVAVKVFREVPGEEAEWSRQEREIRLLGTLNHPGLVSLHDAGAHTFGDETRLYLVMELLSDPTLDVRMAEGPMPPHEVAMIGAQIAEALAYVHSRGVVHRDVKPANVLISDMAGLGFHRVAKLTDFGIANITGHTQLDSAGKIVGTVTYLAPEQAARERVTSAADVYSLGLVLLEALTGKRPFPGTAIESIAARLSSDPEIPETLAPQWRELLRRMTAREPEARPKAATVSRVLRGRSELVVEGVRSTTIAADIEPDTDPVAPRGQSRTERGVLSGVEVAVLVTAVGIICWFAGMNTGSMLAETTASQSGQSAEQQDVAEGLRADLDELLASGGSDAQMLDGLDQLERRAHSAATDGRLSGSSLSSLLDEIDQARTHYSR